MDEWLMQLQSALSDARTRHEIQSRKSRISRCLSTTKTVYDSNAVQWAVGFLILVNFSVSIWEAETRLVSSDYDATLFDALEISFTVIFCVELFINFIASGVFAFVQDNWNLMDVAVYLSCWHLFQYAHVRSLIRCPLFLFTFFTFSSSLSACVYANSRRCMHKHQVLTHDGAQIISVSIVAIILKDIPGQFSLTTKTAGPVWHVR